MISVSVVIPVYNGEKTIAACIESIENNRFLNYEIVVVNDGSTDKTGEILLDLAKKYGNLRVVDIPNGGVSNARNIGIRVAKGKYIVFVDADDTVSEEYLEKLNEKVERSDLVICNFKCIGTERKVECLEKGYGTYKIEDFNKRFMHFFLHELINSPVNKIYKKDLLERNKVLFPTDLSLGEDLIFNLFYLRGCQNVTIIEDTLYNYNFVSESLSTKIRSNYLEIQKRLLEEMESYIVDMRCNNSFNKEKLSEYHANTYVSFVQDVFQKKNKKNIKKYHFNHIVKYMKDDKEAENVIGNGLQAKYIIKMIKDNNFYSLYIFFYIKENILKPLIKK